MNYSSKRTGGNLGGVRRWILLPIIVVLACVSIILASGIASASSTKSKDHSCSMLISKSGTVLQSTCVTDTRKAARAQTAIDAASSNLLVRLWINAGYTGSAVSIMGNAGACDAGGYGIPHVYINSFSFNASSYKLSSGCVTASYWDGGTRALE